MSFFQRLFIGTTLEFANIELDARLVERFEVSSTITDHPVDTGANRPDHAYRNPRVYSLEGVVSDSPLGLLQAARQIGSNLQQLATTGTVPLTNSVLSVLGEAAPATKRSVAAFISLLEFWREGTIFNVQTAMGLWENLIIKDMVAQVTDENSNMLVFNATLREIEAIPIAVVAVDNLQEGPVAQSGGAVISEGLKQSTDATADTVTKATELLG